MVPPGQDPFNVKLLFDMKHSGGYGSDYSKASHVFNSYRHERVTEGNWRGCLLTSTEFARGIDIGTKNTARVRSIGTQTDAEQRSPCRSASPSVFSKEFRKY